MIKIETNLLYNYTLNLQNNRIPENEHKNYLEWLRYYLDFCHKYRHIEVEKLTDMRRQKKIANFRKIQLSALWH